MRVGRSLERYLVYLLLICSVLLFVDLVLLGLSRSGQIFNSSGFKGGVATHINRNSRGRWRKSKDGPVLEQPSHNPEDFPFNRTELLMKEPQCVPGLAQRRMLNLVGDKLLADSPIFVDKNFLFRPDTMKYPLPLGFKGAETGVMDALKVLKSNLLPDIVNQKSCLRCIVVGSGGLMLNSKLGPVVDNFDFVIRLNKAPVIHFEEDVGMKTSIRILYPEAAFPVQEHFTPDWLIAVQAFKPMDLIWLKTVAQGKTLDNVKGFWSKIPLKVMKKAEDFRLLNPEIVYEAANIIGLAISDGKAKQSVPTTGFIAIIAALKFCDEIAVAGFGYDPKNPHMHLHYYDGLRMDYIKQSHTHKITDETKMLVKLSEQGVIYDLTGGIQVY